VGRLYIREFVLDPGNARSKLWKRSFKIYGYHLLMLGFAFTVVAAFAVHTHKAALINLLDFYLAHPKAAILGSVLLLYCPPLLDILPMYVTFLFFTPNGSFGVGTFRLAQDPGCEQCDLGSGPGLGSATWCTTGWFT